MVRQLLSHVFVREAGPVPCLLASITIDPRFHEQAQHTPGTRRPANLNSYRVCAAVQLYMCTSVQLCASPSIHAYIG
eukprot:8323022-Lingulodinium_polyedra.AAC.1